MARRVYLSSLAIYTAPAAAEPRKKPPPHHYTTINPNNYRPKLDGWLKSWSWVDSSVYSSSKDQCADLIESLSGKKSPCQKLTNRCGVDVFIKSIFDIYLQNHVQRVRKHTSFFTAPDFLSPFPLWVKTRRVSVIVVTDPVAAAAALYVAWRRCQ